MVPVLRQASAGEVRIGQVIENLADELKLSEAEKAELLPSGRQATFANRVHWARTFLMKAGLLESTRRAHFKITERGKQVLLQDPKRIDIRFLSQFDEFRRFREQSATQRDTGTVAEDITQVGEVATPDETMRAAHKQIETTLAQELLERIKAAPAAFFEKLIVNLLLAMGYGGSRADAGRALGRSGDDGVDGVIDQDALGLDRVYIQAKRYQASNNVGAAAIRDFFGSLDRHKAAKGLFVTTSAFSASARETADFLSKRIVLIDGAQLAALMIRHNVGCRVEDTLEIKKIDEDFFDA